MKNILNYLFEHKTLSREEAKQVLVKIGTKQYNQSEITAFLAVYIMRSITVEEFTGFRDALLELCVKIDLSEFDPIDLCGTGGDGKDTFNISTLASFVAAGAGIKVAKHGNVSVSSACGSSNVVEYFGYKFSNNIDKLKKEIDTVGLCFMHAPLFHPAMKNVGPIRKELKVKTFFNMLGPVVNPCFPNKQIVGVFSLEVARLYKYLYEKINKKFIILHSLDGYDEISLTSNFKYISNHADEILSPEDLGLQKIKQEELFGGSTVKEASKTFINILEGNGTKAQNNAVISNAAMAVKCTHNEKTLHECIAIANDSLLGKKALNVFKSLMELQ